MPRYDASRFTPPAPVAWVTLRNPANGAELEEVPMLLDSGADVTLLPRQAVRELNVSVAPDTLYELTGFAENSSVSPIVKLELAFEGRTFRGQFLLVEQEWGIIGRNILNSVTVTLDGPNLAWSI
jgi:hypothetical protein